MAYARDAFVDLELKLFAEICKICRIAVRFAMYYLHYTSNISSSNLRYSLNALRSKAIEREPDDKNMKKKK